MMDICVISFTNIVDDIRIAKEIRELLNSGFDVGGIGIGKQADIKNEFQLVGLKLFLYDNTLNAKVLETTWSKIRKNMVRIRHCFFVIRKLIELKPKIVHVCNLELLIVVYMICRIKKIKIVYDSFEIWADMGRVLFKNKIFNSVIVLINKKLLMLFEKPIVNNIHGFICVSNSMAEYFAKIYKVKIPIVVTNCPYSIKRTKSKCNDCFEVLYHGYYSPGRGIEELIMSAKNFNNNIRIVLRIANIYNEKYLTDLIIKSGVQNKVFVEKPVAMSEVVKEASRSNVGAVLTLPTNTNHMYTVSNKIFDYINAGLPVIMSNVKEHIYLNNKYNIGIVIDDLTPENIADAIMQLSGNMVLFNALSNNSLQAAKELNWEVESKKLIRLYEGIIGTHHQPPHKPPTGCLPCVGP